MTPKQLLTLLNKLLKNDDEATPYTFFVNEHEVVKELSTVVDTAGVSTEGVLPVVYQPQAVFKVGNYPRRNALTRVAKHVGCIGAAYIAVQWDNPRSCRQYC